MSEKTKLPDAETLAREPQEPGEPAILSCVCGSYRLRLASGALMGKGSGTPNNGLLFSTVCENGCTTAFAISECADGVVIGCIEYVAPKTKAA